MIPKKHVESYSSQFMLKKKNMKNKHIQEKMNKALACVSQGAGGSQPPA